MAAAIAIAATAVCTLLAGGLHYNARLRDSNADLQRAVAHARSAEGRAQANARVADAQRDLALKAFLELANGVQTKLQDSPATLKLRRSLLDTAVAGLAEIARSTEQAAPDLDRATAHRKLADVYRQLGRNAEASRQLELSLALAKDLAARAPDDLDVLECLGIADCQLAWLDILSGKSPEARELSRHGVAACEAVLAVDPARPLAREYLIRNHQNIGQMLLSTATLSEALSTFNTTLDLGRRWAADEPKSVRAKESIMMSEVKLADAYGLLVHDWPSSRLHYFAAIDICRQLVAAQEGRPYHRRSLAFTLVNFVELAIVLRHTEEARPLILEAVRLATGLVDSDPDQVDNQILLAEAQAHAAGVDGAEAKYEEAAERLRPALERLNRLKSEGKLQGYPSYEVEFVQRWADDLTYFESATRALKDAAFVRSHRPDMALRLLNLRLKTLTGRRDWPGLAATAEASCDMQSSDAGTLNEIARICAACIEAMDAFSLAGGSAGDRQALRRRCGDRGVAALSSAIDLGWNDAQYLARADEMKPLRDHPGFRALIERLTRVGTPR